MTDAAVLHRIVVTGASSGLGQALALAYAAPGVVLGLIGRDAGRLQASADACRARGAEVVTGCFDLREAKTVKTWLDAFDTRHPIDLLISNAAVTSVLANTNDWEYLTRTAKVVDTNFYGALHTVLPVIERMRAHRQGQIAVIASLLALWGTALCPAYCASKAALKGWADSVRPLLREQSIALSVVLPVFLKTPMSDTYVGGKAFMWTCDRAADHIRRKLAAHCCEIAFPFQAHLNIRLEQLLPIPLGDWFIKRSTYLLKEKTQSRPT